MKKIEAIIKPSNLDGVKDALNEIGVEEMTVSEVKAFGRQKTQRGVYRGTEFSLGFLPELKIELVLPDGQADAAVAAIVKGARTAPVANSQVLVSQVDDPVGRHADELVEHAA